MYGGESWNIKKTKHLRIDAFRLRCWTRLLRSLLDSRESKPVHPKGNQPWVFTGRTDAEAQAPVLWPPDAKNWLIGKGPDAGQEKRARMRWLLELTDLVDMSFSKLQEIVKDWEAWYAAVHWVSKSWTWLSKWTTKTTLYWASQVIQWLNKKFACQCKRCGFCP